MKLTETLELSLKSGARHDSLKQSVKLRAYALTHGWPAKIANELRVVNNDGIYTISYPSWIREEVLDLEYGNPSTPPSAALRNFLTSQIDTDDLNDGISKGLKELGVI